MKPPASAKTRTAEALDRAPARRSGPLPAPVRRLFWDYDAGKLRLERDRDLIIGRVLATGPWETVQWLRSQVGDAGLRDWIERHQGRGLTPQQLRYWELMLDLPRRTVDTWLKDKRRSVWDDRVAR